jgi:glycosyltransferase involved in cell wall biosynthesis
VFEGFAPATEAIARYWPAARTRIVHNYPKALFEHPAGELPSPDPRRLVYVGGLTEVRGIRPMLRAVRDVRTRHPRLTLELFGRIMDASLADDVAGAVAEGWCLHSAWLEPEVLASRCHGAGVGLLAYLPIPDHLESLPTKLFEYMAMGIPVLASDFPLWRELVHDSGAGRVAEPASPAYANALEAMVNDPAGLVVHARRGLEAYRTRFRWEAEREHLRWHLERAREHAQA